MSLPSCCSVREWADGPLCGWHSYKCSAGVGGAGVDGGGWHRTDGGFVFTRGSLGPTDRVREFEPRCRRGGRGRPGGPLLGNTDTAEEGGGGERFWPGCLEAPQGLLLGLPCLLHGTALEASLGCVKQVSLPEGPSTPFAPDMSGAGWACARDRTRRTSWRPVMPLRMALPVKWNGAPVAAPAGIRAFSSA